MNKYWVFCSVVALVCIVATIAIAVMSEFYVPKDKGLKTEEEYKELVQDIDSLSSHIDTITKERDSLSTVIDTAKAKVVIIEKKYEKDYIDITNQSIRDDIEFFSDYISQNDARLSNSNNSSSVKEN